MKRTTIISIILFFTAGNFQPGIAADSFEGAGCVKENATKSICATKGIKIFIAAPDIRSVDALGSNDMVITDIDNHRISISLDGAGDLNLSGNTKNFEAKLFGSNSLKARDLRSEKTSISIAGTSEASVYASEVLKIDITGIGEIMYYGNPKTIQKDISGIGDIRSAE